MAIKTWVFGKYFLKSKWGEPVTSRKTTDFQTKILENFEKFWKTCLPPMNLTVSQYLNTSSLKLLYKEICKGGGSA